jgi:acetyl-CoA carboxylase biotin carboxyl carrier protein
MDLKEIKKLVNLVETANISKLCIESKGTKIEIKKELQSNLQTIVQTAPVAIPAAQPAPTTGEIPSITKEEPPVLDKNTKPIQSQMVGTFYTSASPDAPAYVKEGDRVKTGQVVCIIEAMKLFNEIVSEHTGTIIKCCVDNTTPVEYGQDLFHIKLD